MSFTAFYDLEFSPVSFDFVTWLVRAKLAAGSNKLHVVIVPFETGLAGFSRHWGKHDEHATRWRLWHICVASCPLAEATVTIAPSLAVAKSMRSEPFWWPEGRAHFIGPLVDAAKAGEKIPMLRATEAARRYVGAFLSKTTRPIVTLTLRRQDTDPDRNSNPHEWDQFSDWLKSRGYAVITLDDTNEALMAGRGYFVLDPDLRLALYEIAKMNCSGATGPDSLLKFSAAPYLNFDQIINDGWRDHYRKYLSLEKGDQLPWARPDQKVIYSPSTFENMKREFELRESVTS